MCCSVIPGKLAGIYSQPEILVAFAGWVGADERPEIIRRQMMADQNFLPVDDVVLAVAYRFGLAVGHVAAALRLGQHLPDGKLAARHRRQEFHLLFLRAELHQRRRHQTRQSVKDRTERQTVAVDFGFEHELMIESQTGAAVFHWIRRKQPALLTQFSGQRAAKTVFLIVLPRRPIARPAQMLAALHVFRQPGAHLLAKRADLGSVLLQAKVHGDSPFSVRSDKFFALVLVPNAQLRRYDPCRRSRA